MPLCENTECMTCGGTTTCPTVCNYGAVVQCTFLASIFAPLPIKFCFDHGSHKVASTICFHKFSMHVCQHCVMTLQAESLASSSSAALSDKTAEAAALKTELEQLRHEFEVMASHPVHFPAGCQTLSTLNTTIIAPTPPPPPPPPNICLCC